jgi:hypothetical protein
MFMTDKMAKEEFEGQLKRFGCSGISAICQMMHLKTGALVMPQTVRTHLDRYGHLSTALTAALRLLFRELERNHEQAG